MCVGKTKTNHQDLLIVGESKNPKNILNQDHIINFLSKVSYLQSFFTKRYRNFQISPDAPKGTSKCCLLIEVLAKVTRKRQKMWTKKLLKYIRKNNKKKNSLEKIDSNNFHIQPNQ
jgi:hypothetical protein